jgi:hypothetical protein
MTSSKYSVVPDAHKQAKALAEKGRVFALFLRVHHRDVYPESPLESAATGGSKRSRKKRRAAASDVVPARQESSVTAAKGPGPSWLPREILELIMRLLGPMTMYDVLAERQRALRVPKVTDFGRLHEKKAPFAFLTGPLQVRYGFPSLGEADVYVQGYSLYEPAGNRPYDGKMMLVMRHKFTETPSWMYLTFTVEVDLRRVVVHEAAGNIEIPPAAISVKTNAGEVREAAGLTLARVQEMERFALRGVMRPDGDIDFFEVANGTDDKRPSRRFQAQTWSHFVAGMVLDQHAGLAVGDRVRLVKCYKAYDHFALGQEGVIRGIALQTFVLYYVELGDESAEISQLIKRTHVRGSGVFDGQAWHHIECQRFHLEKCA